MKKAIVTITALLLGLQGLVSDNVSISGIDTTNMIFNGTVSLYLNITDDAGEPLAGVLAEELSLSESTGSDEYSTVDIVRFEEGINEDKGIRFLLLVDNSGSMYDRIDGSETENYDETRISTAVKALNTLIQSMQGSNDRAGLALFNTYYKELVPVGTNRNLVVESMQMIEKPGKDESFTELNAAVYSAAGDFATHRGRKIIIVLSDGENYPFLPVRNEDNPQFGSVLYSTEDMIRELKKNSTTLYGINFGTGRDPELEKAAIGTGGYLFEADSEEALADVYNTIRERILSEYYVEYKTDTTYSERKYVKAELDSAEGISEPVFYYSGNLFGKPSDQFSRVFFAAIPVALLAVVLLALRKQSAPAEKAGLEVTDFSGATQMFDINSTKTVIGSSDSDDVTVVNSESDSQNNATIVFDDKKSAYTVVSDSDVLVNNNPVKTRVLEAGDVININGATIVFNDKQD